MRENAIIKILIDSQELKVINPAITVKAHTGKHTCMTLRGIVEAESYALAAGMNTREEIQVGLGETMEVLFCGLVTYLDIRIQNAEGTQYQEIYLEAMSHTCLLDQRRENAAFQKKGISYRELLDMALSDYSDPKCLFGEGTAEKTMDQFVVQYKETDWEFIARLASRIQMPLVACHNSKGIRFTMGVVWGDRVYAIPQAEEDRVETIHDEGSYLKWQSEDPDAPIFNIGDAVSYKGMACYVKETELTVKDYVLRQTCLICGRTGFEVEEIENEALTGLSLPGSVKEVKGNQLKIALDIDAVEEPECWFVYSTFYSTFYCMPEKGDRINLYFPDHREEHAFVLNSVGANTNEVEIGGNAGSGGSGGTGGSQGAGSSASGTGQAAGAAIDITPYLEQLLNSEAGKLVNVEADFGDESSQETGGQDFADGMAAGDGVDGVDGVDAVGGAAQSGYDFETLANNNKIKVLCSRNGRMVILDDESGSISIVCDDGTHISLYDGGIALVTDKRIVFTAKNDIRFNGLGSIYLEAEDEVVLSCQDSFFKMTPEEILVLSNDIRMNEE